MGVQETAASRARQRNGKGKGNRMRPSRKGWSEKRERANCDRLPDTHEMAGAEFVEYGLSKLISLGARWGTDSDIA